MGTQLPPKYVHNMAVASGWAGRVLARPLFRRLNVHVRTLNTREITRKTAANFTDKKVTLR